MTWEMVRLGDLISPAKPKRANDGEYPLLSMTMHNGLINQAERFKKQIASVDLSGYQVVERGQLVVGFPIDEGVLDFQELHPAGIVSPAYGVWNLQDNSIVDRRFAKLVLRSPRSIEYFKQKLRGSTARRRSLPRSDFLALPIPLPPLEEQRRIAAILDEADEIRTKRCAQLALLDELPQSLFHEMFGDPKRNTLNLPSTILGETCDIVTGNTPSRADEANYGGTLEWVKSNNLGDMNISVAHEHLSDSGRAQGRVAPVGSILVTCIAGSPQSIGKASIADREVAFNQQINAILPSTILIPAFLYFQLRTATNLVREKSTGGMKGLVSKSAFSSIRVLCPPLAEQQAFAEKVEAIQAERSRITTALKADDELFSALQYRAFRGEL